LKHDAKLGDVNVSTIAADHKTGIIMAGGFKGELVCKNVETDVRICPT